MPDISAFCPACGRSTSASAGRVLPQSEDTTQTENMEFGVRERVLAALAYLALVPAVLFLILPSLKTARFVKFHSWQSVFFVAVTIVLAGMTRALFWLLAIIPAIGFLFATLMAGLVTLALVTVWCILVIKALQGKGYELPWLGRWAETLAN